ncbi:hypothetical protein [Streptomyces sp. HNM0574]|uniref:hypothetical protein n=1 Tax=Streptomyces sp. HNM0574 TaxID=2714954 RepID=UPI00146C3CD9|nr:hypothetical protein [Streptomyces sp. HNM0574]NLU70159.1 hypothetical protein [Streptomyces sp. HNM0574]
MTSGDSGKERGRPHYGFSFLMAGLFALLAVWTGTEDLGYTVALLGVAALWAIQGIVAVRRSRTPESPAE